MKNENLSAEERLKLLIMELEEAEAAKKKSDNRILSLKENLSAEKKNNKQLNAKVELAKERIKNAENAELRECLEQNGILISDVFAAVKDGKIPKSSAAVPTESDNAEDVSSVTQKGEENDEVSDS